MGASNNAAHRGGGAGEATTANHCSIGPGGAMASSEADRIALEVLNNIFTGSGQGALAPVEALATAFLLPSDRVARLMGQSDDTVDIAKTIDSLIFEWPPV